LAQIFTNGDPLILNVLKDLINAYGENFGLIDNFVMAHFLAQDGHESNGFTKTGSNENMNYTTPERLLKIFPSFFSLTDPSKRNPNEYVRQPEKLGNLVYVGRNGNGDEQSGDGFKYRGRGAFQLTGKANYQAFTDYYSNFIGSAEDIMTITNLIASDLKIGIISAMWYFKTRVLDKLNELTIASVTKKINSTYTVDLEDRKSWFELAIQYITC
jgi:putative chitinase